MNILSPSITPTAPKRIPKNMCLGFRVCHPDLRSRSGFRWPFPGQWAEASGPFLKHRGSCPDREGDGICVAHTTRGASSGGIKPGTYLLVAYDPRDVLGDNEPGKVRVKRALVLDVFTFDAFMGPSANLTYANLTCADLRSADLAYADLTSADLTCANLRYADLAYADLTSANLTYANLRYADLASANLTYANLRYADLAYADLASANLTYANLRYAYASDLTTLPVGCGWKVCNGRIEKAS